MKYPKRFWLLLPAILTVYISCQPDSGGDIERLNAVVERVGERYVPDSRVDVFQVVAEPENGRVALNGDVLNPDLPGILLDSLRQVFPKTEFVNRIQVLPTEALRSRSYGIVNISVANMRRTPEFQAELVNQTLLGTVVRIYKADGGFYFIQNRDEYLGWVSKSSLVAIDSATAAAWENAPRVTCTANYGVVAESIDLEDGEILVDLVPGAALKKLNQGIDYLEVETPDGRSGFVRKEKVVDWEDLEKIPPSPGNIIRTSRTFLGVPYLWGGTSAKGFDCSGFVQTVFRLNNIELPRDAGQMVEKGSDIDPGAHFENLLPGDLLFFGGNPERISHVAIYLGEKRYIHASTSVHINSLDETHPLYNKYRHDTFRKAKRIL